MLSGSVYTEFGNNGLRELEFTHGGILYRSRIEIKQTQKTKSQRAFLHYHLDDQGWQPVSMSDHTVSDGKTTTYDACLTHILGPQSLYYLSAFRAQGAPKLAEYSDPKGLMRDLLALDEPAQLRDNAKLVMRDLKREYEVQSAKQTVAEINAARQQLSYGNSYSTSGGAPIFMQEGGPVEPGRPYIVGERGPELFVPSQSGQIVPTIASPIAQTVSNVSTTLSPTFNVAEDIFNNPVAMRQLQNIILGVLVEAI